MNSLSRILIKNDETFQTVLQADEAALTAFMHEHLKPLVDYITFALPENWHFLFKQVYATGCQFPLNVYWPRRIRQFALDKLHTKGFRSPIDLSPKDARLDAVDHDCFAARVERLATHKLEVRRNMQNVFHHEAFLRDACAVFDALHTEFSRLSATSARRLGRISQADATLAAYMAIIMHADLPNRSLGKHVESRYPHLVAHSQGVATRLFRTQR